MIKGINELNSEEGLEIGEGEEIAQLGLGFAHDVAVIGERVESVWLIELIINKLDGQVREPNQ